MFDFPFINKDGFCATEFYNLSNTIDNGLKNNGIF